jgi:hypothetical protein
MRSLQRIGAYASAVLSLTIVCLFSATPGWAQTRSTLTGTVTDGTGAVLPGTTVTLQSPDLVGGAQTANANERGVYRFSDLPPGTYQMTATLTGFQTVERKALRLPFATTLTVDFSLAVGSAETVTVEGATPTVDVTTAQSTATVDKDLIVNLPLFSNQRESNNIFELSPGSTYGAAYGGGSNNLMIDGQPGTMSFGQSANSVVISPNWMEEVNVVALGANAEYGEFSGVTANLVVRNGSNDFHGLLEYRTTRPSWLASHTEGLPESVQTLLAST